MAERRVQHHNLTEFFRDLVRHAMRRQEVCSTEETEFYLVKLLEGFSHPQRGWFDRPLALEYLEAFHAPAERRYGQLKRVGDTALFLSGLFVESLHRKVISSDYYIGLGRTAYGHLSRLSADVGAAPADSFAELAERFPDFVGVLAEISLESLFPGDKHTLRVYTRWLYTRGKRDEQWLIRQGLIPCGPASRIRH
jgi:hypothetical protein